MIRRVACLLILFFAGLLPATAQQKYGHINGMEIMSAMPEFKQMKAAIDRKQREQENTMKNLYKQYEQVLIDLNTHGYSLMQAVAEEKQIEALEIKQKIEDLQLNADADVMKLQEKLTKPIISKMEKVLDIVAKENGYTYIFDISTPGMVIYYPENEGDLTDVVKKKMGL
jgi:outer membrane protein